MSNEFKIKGKKEDAPFHDPILKGISKKDSEEEIKDAIEFAIKEFGIDRKDAEEIYGDNTKK